MGANPETLDGFAVIPGGVVASRGFKAGSIAAGIKASGALDLGGIFSTVAPCTVAATFTTNRVTAANVEINRARVAGGQARGVVFNSGNANTYTGAEGRADAMRMAELFAERQDVAPEEILMASTGVIGFRLPMDRVADGIRRLELTSVDGIDVATAMMTTDAYPKTIAVEVPLSIGTVRIGGAAKGAGMIHPNMATMHSFVTTDAALDASFALSALRAAVDDSFNVISIDGDQSTSDTVLMFANGASETPKPEGADAETFGRALRAVCQHLAREIVRNGEGVTKLVTIEVRGAVDATDARRAGRGISTSLLVKTAVFGGDPNWGRVVAALGNSGAEFDPEALDIWIGDTCTVEDGRIQDYHEPDVAAHLRQSECRIAVDLHAGPASATAWTGDLSHDYVTINAEYMT
ncbi:MAG: bifunctional glutamate N-acetyltransferase/amino-acid acetyltransferase ArgJ [Chloroflexi bacterium]|nr:bifunctional glutamate N-acetyltransferase/amino-acid acetyltransferase ArgJ [Chloroflexota bacterium]